MSILPPPTPALLLPVCPHLAHVSSQRAFPPYCGWRSTFLQAPTSPSTYQVILVVFIHFIHLPLDLRPSTSRYMGPNKLYLLIDLLADYGLHTCFDLLID